MPEYEIFNFLLSGWLCGGELPGWTGYSPCQVEKTLCLYETELPGKHEAYILKWTTSTGQITKLCKYIEMNATKYKQTFLILGVWLSFIVFICASEMSPSKTHQCCQIRIKLYYL